MHTSIIRGNELPLILCATSSFFLTVVCFSLIHDVYFMAKSNYLHNAYYLVSGQVGSRWQNSSYSLPVTGKLSSTFPLPTSKSLHCHGEWGPLPTHALFANRIRPENHRRVGEVVVVVVDFRVNNSVSANLLQIGLWQQSNTR